ncbi:PH domain-containing protein [Streptomyces sp. NPDC021749]|uniref:PH domain-containing protein n=1 Tax=Streptomyces sp. NPDC021749 TaxID=3154905 RepID=UPI0033C0B342
MTRQDRTTPPPQQYAERSYRSPASLVGGVLLLLLGGWLGADALLRGTPHTRLTTVFALLLGVPLVAAFTLRPLVRAGDERLTVRNPFRTITLPWGAVEELRASFATEVFTTAGKFQLWAIPVSLRQRKKANRQALRGAGADAPRFGPDAGAGPVPRAMADQALDELREIKERVAGRADAQGEPVVRWSYGILAPLAVGAVGLAVMLAL